MALQVKKRIKSNSGQVSFENSGYIQVKRNPILTVRGRKIYYFCVPGNPIPKQRTTQRAKWKDPQVRRSLEYQTLVAQNAKYIWKIPRFPKNVLLEIKCFFYRKDRRRVDRDNLVKSIQDGLEHGGIVYRDSAFVRGSDCMATCSEDPHTKVFITEAVSECSVLANLGEPATIAIDVAKAFNKMRHKSLTS